MTYSWHIRREARANLLDGKLEISPILTKGRRKGGGVGRSVLHRIAPLFLLYMQVHLYYLNLTRREVCVRSFNGKLLVSSILVQGWRKFDIQISQFLVKSLNYSWDEYSSTWTNIGYGMGDLKLHGNDDISQAWGWQHSISQSEMAIIALR